MYNYYNKRKLTISVFLIILLAIGIGYAYLTSNLSISGNTNVSTNTWNIHFENIQVKDGSVTASTSPTLSNNNTSITYTIDLNRPKEYYEFTVDVKNDGTLPGKVSVSTLSGITTEASSVIDYSVTYTNGNPVSVGDILNAGDKKVIRVKIFYKDDISESDFPSNNINLTLTYTLQYIQSEEDALTAGNILQDLSSTESCITKYTGNVTDRVGVTEQATNVYFDSCYNKRNIIYNNMCWQIIRTTETGGLKIIYNGKPNDNKCLSTRSGNYTTGGYASGTSELSSNYLYGSHFIFDNTSNNYFTLTDTFVGTWSDSTYHNMIGTFTCKNETGKCNTIYSVNGYQSNTVATTSELLSSSLGDYASMAYNTYNAHHTSPAMAGYMFNKVYKENTNHSIAVDTKFGSTFTYENGTYTLSEPMQSVSYISEYNTISNYHYTCWNTSGTCNTISYIYFFSSGTIYYIDIKEGKNANDALNEMLYANDVNKYNSTIKGVVDSWFSQHLYNRIYDFEDAVFCNNRNILNYGGWNPNGGDVTTELTFKNYNTTNDLSCTNDTDQLSVSNNKAKLKYPVSLLSSEEATNIANGLYKSRDVYWLLSPYRFTDGVSVRDSVNGNQWVKYARGVRPVLSLISSMEITSGTGSEEEPWIIE